MLTAEEVRRLPKVELHLHLDGSLRAATVLDMARDQGIPLAGRTPEELRHILQVWGKAKDLAEYLTKFELPVLILQRPEALTRVACELVEDLSAENVRYAEVRFAPWLHTRRRMRLSQAIEAVLAGLRLGEARTGIRTRLIVCCMRQHSPQDNLTLAEVALGFRDAGLGGLDLAGDEALSTLATLPVAAFRLAKEAGLHRTVHAGEGSGPESIRLALDELWAERLGHGVRLREDPRLMRRVKEEEIALEMCPTSNLQTGVVRSLARHPMDAFLSSGLCVTVNTDNRRVSDTSLTREYMLMVQRFGWGLQEIQTTTLNSLRAAFLPEAEKLALITAFKGEWGL